LVPARGRGRDVCGCLFKHIPHNSLCRKTKRRQASIEVKRSAGQTRVLQFVGWVVKSSTRIAVVKGAELTIVTKKKFKWSFREKKNFRSENLSGLPTQQRVYHKGISVVTDRLGKL